MLGLAALFPPVLLLAGVASSIAFLCERATDKLARGTLVAPSLYVMALFNPWTYNELVAGHMTMLIAYAATLLLIAEMVQPLPKPLVMTIAIVFIAQQLQFYVVAVALTALWGIFKREWTPLVAGVIVGAPVAIGIALGYSELLSTPYTLPWQEGQSIVLSRAVLLSGYYANYDRFLPPLSDICAGALCALALAGFAGNIRATVARSTAVGTLAFLLLALGTNGPLPAAYEFAVVHIKASGLFRELYDLMSYVAVGYLVLAAMAASRWPKSSPVFVLIAIGMVTTWAFAPPARYWVRGDTIPPLDVNAAPYTRYAVIPAFQPLSYLEQGSGADPDLYPRERGVEPINQYLPTYPAVTALAQEVFHHDPTLLEGLSVSSVYRRSGFCSDSGALTGQISTHLNENAACGGTSSSETLPASPEFGLQTSYAVASLARIGSGDVLLPDAVRAGIVPAVATHVPEAPNTIVDPRYGWISASLAFLTHSEIGQPFGGVYTSSTIPFALAGGQYALVYVKGHLLDSSGATVAASAASFHWAHVRPGTAFVRCLGSCAIALLSSMNPGYRVDPKPQRIAALPFARITPWLVRADVPAMNPGNLLRFNERYSGWWTMFAPAAKRTSFTHVRVDGAANGWLVSERYGGGSVYIFEARSLVEQLVEILSTVALALLFRISFVRSRAPV